MQVGDVVALNNPVPTGVAPGGTQYQASGQAKIIGSRVANGQQYYNLDQTAYGGGTGWASAGAVQNALNAPAPQAAAPAPPSNIGISATDLNPVQAPDLQAITNLAYKTGGLDTLNSTADQQMQEINNQKKALVTATSTINDNPFLSEATRVGKVAKLNQQANQSMQVALDSYNTTQGKIAQVKADAQNQVSIATGQYQLNKAQYDAATTRFNSLLSAGLLNDAGPQDIAALSQSTGISSGLITKAIDMAKAPKYDPQVTSYTDPNTGNVTFVTVDKNSGRVLNTSTVAGIAPAKAAAPRAAAGGGAPKAAAGPSAAQQKQTLIGQIASASKNYHDLKTIVNDADTQNAIRAGLITVKDVYDTYNGNSPFGHAYNTLAEVQAGKITK